MGREAAGQSRVGLQAEPLRAVREAGLKAVLLWRKKTGKITLAQDRLAGQSGQDVGTKRAWRMRLTSSWRTTRRWARAGRAR